MTPPEHITAGEFSRWLQSDELWKAQVLIEMREHRQETREQGERLAALEAVKSQAQRAEDTAISTKRWTVIGGIIAAIVNGFALAFNK